MRGEFWRGVHDSVSRAAFACILCRARDGCDSRSARAFFRWAVSVSRPDARLSAASLISMALIGAVGPAGTKKGAGIATKVPADARAHGLRALHKCVLEYPPRANRSVTHARSRTVQYCTGTIKFGKLKFSTHTLHETAAVTICVCTRGVRAGE